MESFEQQLNERTLDYIGMALKIYRAHHIFGSLTMLVVAPSSSPECGDPRGDKSGSLTTPEIVSFVALSPRTLLMRDKGPHQGNFFFFLDRACFHLACFPFFLVTPQSEAWPHGLWQAADF